MEHLIKILASVTLFELMVTIGLGIRLSETIAVVRDWRLLSQAAFANYVCVPATAVSLLLMFHAQPLIAAGFLIAAVCPGAPYGPPFTAMAKGNATLAVGLMVVLAGSSAVIAPVLLKILLPLVAKNESLSVDLMMMVGTLGLTQFLPLCIGLSTRHWRPTWANRLQKPAGRLSVVLNLAMLGAIVISQFATLISIRPRAYVGMSALVSASVVAGWLFGGPGGDRRTAMAMATGVRNVGVSLVIATSNFAGTSVIMATTVFGVFQTIFMALLALAWGRWQRKPTCQLIAHQ
jgi:BASS family bile acid:Na+ symporter